MTTNEKIFVAETWRNEQYPIRLKALENIVMDMLQSEDHDATIYAQEIMHKYRVMTSDYHFADLISNGRIPL